MVTQDPDFLRLHAAGNAHPGIAFYHAGTRSVETTAAGDRVFLPFEGDGTLSVILSKAFLLAEDTKIKDPTIVSQLKR